VTPTLSVEAVHVRFTWVDEVAVATRLVGIDGAVVSPGGATVNDFGDPVRRNETAELLKSMP
jgi:hypothetical protein